MVDIPDGYPAGIANKGAYLPTPAAGGNDPGFATPPTPNLSSGDSPMGQVPNTSVPQRASDAGFTDADLPNGYPSGLIDATGDYTGSVGADDLGSPASDPYYGPNAIPNQGYVGAPRFNKTDSQ